MAKKNQYFIMRNEKRKARDLYGIELEANREVGADNKKKFPNSDIDNAKTSENYFLVEGHNWKKIIDETAAQYGLKPRKNSTLLIDSLYTASADFFKNLTLEQQQEFFHDCLQFHIHEYCNDNPHMIVNARVHMDEATPHMTLQSMPIYVDREGQAHYSAKDILGGKKAMSQHQDHFYEQVGKRWGLSRGKQLDGEKKKKHLSVQDYKIEENEKKLREQNRELVTPEQVKEFQQQADEAIEKRDRALTELAGLQKYKQAEADRAKKRYHDMELNLDRMTPTLEVRTKSLPEKSNLREEAEKTGQKKIRVHAISDADLQLILGAQKNIYRDKEEEAKRFKAWERNVHFDVMHFEEAAFWKTDSGKFKSEAIAIANRNANKRISKKQEKLFSKEIELNQRESKVKSQEEQEKTINSLRRFKDFAVKFVKEHFNVDLEQEWQKHQKARTEAPSQRRKAFDLSQEDVTAQLKQARTPDRLQNHGNKFNR